MMKKSVILVIALSIAISFFSFSSANAGSLENWEFVYKHDSDGNAISGSLTELVNAIRNGADVKVIVHSTISGDNSWLLDKVNANIAGDAVTGWVFSQKESTDKSDLVRRMLVVKTNGQQEHIYESNPYYSYNVQEHSVSWFVNY